MKRCTKCQVNEAPSYHAWCKECFSEYQLNNYHKYRAGRLARLKKWRKDNPDYWINRMKELPIERIKQNARQLLNTVVKAGKVSKLPCERCDNPKSEGHHNDYNKPLEVIWLYKPHHAELHRKYQYN